MREALPWLVRPIAGLVYRLFRRKGVWLFINNSQKPWGGNSRAVCDAAVNDRRLREIVILNFGKTSSQHIRSLYRDKPVPVRIYEHWGAASLWAALCSDVMFVHEYGKYYLKNFSVNLWHGIPLKRIGQFQRYPAVTKPPKGLRRRPRRRLWRPTQMTQHQRLISSSVHDHVVMTACFHLHPDRVLNSGLPRNDWMSPNFVLPLDLADDEKRLLEMCRGRKLCLYAPTFRDAMRDWAPMSRDQVQRLSKALAEQGYVLGIRPHITVTDNFFDDLDDCIDLSSSKFSEVQIILRNTDLLITDYSSTALDFMLTKRPILSYAPDLEAYSRGYLYSFRDVFPGPILEEFDDLLTSVVKACNDLQFQDECVAIAQRVFHLFHERERHNISAKVVDEIIRVRESRIIEAE